MSKTIATLLALGVLFSLAACQDTQTATAIPTLHRIDAIPDGGTDAGLVTEPAPAVEEDEPGWDCSLMGNHTCLLTVDGQNWLYHYVSDGTFEYRELAP